MRVPWNFAKILCLLCALCTLTCCPALGEESSPAWAEPCVPGPYLHEHADERIRVVIQKFEQPDLVYFVADVQVKDPASLQTAFANGRYGGPGQSVSTIAKANDALLAINCDDYLQHDTGILIRNGQAYRRKRTTRHTLLIDAQGNLRPLETTERNADTVTRALLEEEIRQTFVFGPLLVKDGAIAPIPEGFALISKDPKRLEPRTAIGQIGPLHYVVLVVDGRQEGYSLGASLQQLQELFVALGAQTAFNLDGGGSTTLYFQGELINFPSSVQERDVSDILMFK